MTTSPATTSPRMIALVIGLIAILAGAALAHEIGAPVAVQADGAGHFEVDVTITITSPIEFGFSQEWDLGNTDVGMHADGFCMTVIEPAEYVWTVSGNLLDPTQNGEVGYEHSMCDGWTGYVTTVILAPTVSAEASTWSAVKALYR